MPIITLTTDFGHADIYSGRFKGKLLSIQNDINIIDISHQIPAFNIVTGAYSLKHTYESFPKGTCHIIRVNEQGITNEGLLIASYKGYYFLAPNNGVLPLALSNQFDWVRSVDFDKLEVYRADDIFAEVVKSVLEARYEEISLPISNYITNSEWSVNKKNDIIKGMVVIVDYFGNLITNIHTDDIAMYINKFNNITIQYRDKEAISGLVESYNDVVEGERMCRVNDLGYLEIAINNGEAAKLLGIKYGQIVNVIFS